MSIQAIICAGTALAFAIIFIISLCRAGGRADNQMEKLYHKRKEEADHAEAHQADLQTDEEKPGMEQAAPALRSSGDVAGREAGGAGGDHQLPQGSVDDRRHLPVMNTNGEVASFGPRWACGQYGAEGHSYNDCPDCHDNFRLLFNPARGTA